MSIISTIEDLINKSWFTHLIDEDDLKVYQDKLSNYIQYLNSRFEIHYNITTGEKKYTVNLPGAPLILPNMTDTEEKIFQSVFNYAFTFSKDDFVEPGLEFIVHQPFIIENSYDINDKNIRKTLRSMLDRFYSFDEEFIEKCLNTFDGDNPNLVEGICLNHEDKWNGFSCYEKNIYDVPTSRDLTRNKDLITRLTSLYGFDEKTVSDLLTNLEPVLDDDTIRILYMPTFKKDGSQNYFVFTLFSFYNGEMSVDFVKNVTKALVSSGRMSNELSRDLIDWNDFSTRIVNGFSFVFEKVGKKTNLSILANYGFRENPTIS